MKSTSPTSRTSKYVHSYGLYQDTNNLSIINLTTENFQNTNPQNPKVLPDLSQPEIPEKHMSGEVY